MYVPYNDIHFLGGERVNEEFEKGLCISASEKIVCKAQSVGNRYVCEWFPQKDKGMRMYNLQPKQKEDEW